MVAPDLRGHGQSTKPDQEAAYSLATFGGDVVGLADALGWDGFALLGHSMGGMIAQVVATGAPERVEALVLMDTGHGRVPIDPALVELGVATARDQGMEVIADFMATHGGRPPDHRGLPAKGGRGPRLWGPRRSEPAGQRLGHVRGHDAGADLGHRSTRVVARRWRSPPWCWSGSQDAPFLEPSRAMAEAIAGAELVVVEGGGHSPQFEAPDGWWLAVSSFLDRVAPDAAPAAG